MKNPLQYLTKFFKSADLQKGPNKASFFPFALYSVTQVTINRYKVVQKGNGNSTVADSDHACADTGDERVIGRCEHYENCPMRRYDKAA